MNSIVREMFLGIGLHGVPYHILSCLVLPMPGRTTCTRRDPAIPVHRLLEWRTTSGSFSDKATAAAAAVTATVHRPAPATGQMLLLLLLRHSLTVALAHLMLGSQATLHTHRATRRMGSSRYQCLYHRLVGIHPAQRYDGIYAVPRWGVAGCILPRVSTAMCASRARGGGSMLNAAMHAVDLLGTAGVRTALLAASQPPTPTHHRSNIPLMMCSGGCV